MSDFLLGYKEEMLCTPKERDLQVSGKRYLFKPVCLAAVLGVLAFSLGLRAAHAYPVLAQESGLHLPVPIDRRTKQRYHVHLDPDRQRQHQDSHHAHEVQGRKIRWTMTAPGKWIGGNYYQIERYARGADNEFVRLLSNEMQRSARKLDVYMLHLEDAYEVSRVPRLGGFTTRTLTEVRVNLVKDPAFQYLEREDSRNLTWSASKQIIQLDHPQGSQTRIVRRGSLTTGGFRGYQATFETTRPNGGKVYEVWHIVILESKQFHIFQLEVDSAKYRTRYIEFMQMLTSVRYD